MYMFSITLEMQLPDTTAKQKKIHTLEDKPNLSITLRETRKADVYLWGNRYVGILSYKPRFKEFSMRTRDRRSDAICKKEILSVRGDFLSLGKNQTPSQLREKINDWETGAQNRSQRRLRDPWDLKKLGFRLWRNICHPCQPQQSSRLSTLSILGMHIHILTSCLQDWAAIWQLH